ncbi:FtsX-like permease family protein [Gordonia sp. (in: high G+C Gram-positive bacteria)]|uniref:FtsX-like permease family protein n=1 Tax=Gordonia sp. (in: high G+C Gram-positive bacteria) TaxID=84139 RepID=UPI00262FB2B5|nr:FtsX-like permease family protein [Gordonia sp. (in: high G+C Gram-positive bacteria)]
MPRSSARPSFFAGTRAAVTRVRVLNLRELAGHRLRVITSLIVVVVSSGLLIAVLGAYGSMSETVRQFNAAISGNATVEVAAIADTGVDDDLIGELREKVTDAKAVVPLVRGTVMIDGRQTTLLGSDARVASLSPKLRAAMGSGRSIDLNALDDGIFAGRATGLHKDQRLSISGVDVRVLDVIDDSGTDVLNGGRFVFAYLGLAQRLAGLGGAVDSIMIVPKPGVSDAALRTQVAGVVDGRASVVNPDFRVKQAEVASSVTRDSTLLVSLVSLIIAGFLVFNTMNMAVASRRQSLAMIRALGARRRHLVGDLLAESAVFGLAGGLLGVPVGILAGRWAVGRLPNAVGSTTLQVAYHLPWYAAPLSVAACVLACIGATALAARSVFAVDPVEAMVPGAAADAESPNRRLLIGAVAAGTATVIGAFVMARTAQGQIALLAGAVYAIGGIVVCFGLTVPMVRGVVAVSRWFRGPGRLAAVNSERAPRRVWATVMTVGVAIAVGIGISGALSNMVGSISNSLAGLSDPDIYVSSRDANDVPVGPILNPEIAEQVARVPGVDRVVGGQWATVNLGDARALLQGLEPGSAAPFIRKASPEAVRQTLDGEGILLSRVLARTLDVKLGDTLRLATPTGYHELVVRDTVNYVTIDSGTGAISSTLMAEWFGRPGSTYLQVFLKPEADVAQAKARIGEIAAKYPGAGDRPVYVYTGAQALAATQRSVQQAGAFTVAIQWIVAGAAAIALLNTLLLSVLERRRELGVLRAMGASRRFVTRMVLAEAGSVAVVGALIGVVLGTGLHVIADKILAETTSIDIIYRPLWSSAGYVATAAALCLLGAIVPAARAARMNISESILSE